jgi:hypothetical protein
MSVNKQCPFERRQGRIDIAESRTPGTSTRFVLTWLSPSSTPRHKFNGTLVDACPSGLVLSLQAQGASAEGGAERYRLQQLKLLGQSGAPPEFARAAAPALTPRALLGVISTGEVQCSVTIVIGPGVAPPPGFNGRVSPLSIYKRGCRQTGTRRSPALPLPLPPQPLVLVPEAMHGTQSLTRRTMSQGECAGASVEGVCGPGSFACLPLTTRCSGSARSHAPLLLG